MFWLVFIVSFIVSQIVIRWATKQLIQRHRRIIANRPRPREVDYYHIGRLEIELFGETKPNVDSFVKPWQKNVYGITADGHIDDVCNVNASMGPVCRNKWHTGRRVQPSPGQGMAEVLRTAESGRSISSRNPNGDRAYDDPDWTDEDGRPW